MWIGNALHAFLSVSWLPLTLGIVIAALSIGDVIFAKKTGSEWTLKFVVVGFSILLLVAQFASGEASSKAADLKLQEALREQRDYLSSVFRVSTDQVIKATNDTATQTQKSAQDQTQAIGRQARQQFTQLQGATLGSTTCPTIVASIDRPAGKPHALAVANLDKKLNMYDVNVELIEWGPPAPGEAFSSVLQTRNVHLPLLVPERTQRVPFLFLSKMSDIDVQVSLTTRTTSCFGRIDAFDTGGNVWVNDHTEMTQIGGKKPVFEQDMHLSPGLLKSRVDPQAQ
jgi:hypothetical protein